MADATPEITKQLDDLYWETVWPELCWTCTSCDAVIAPPGADLPQECPYCGEGQ